MSLHPVPPCGQAARAPWSGLGRPLCAFALIGLCLLALGAGRPVVAGEGEAEGNRALDEYFRGAVAGLDGGEVTLRYDFRDARQVEDFEDRKPFNIEARKGQQIRWFDEQLEIVGNAAARHRAHWMGEVLVTATFTVDADRDVGGFLSPSDATNDFATFTLTETFFHRWDNSDGMLNSIIKFGDQWREGDATGDFTGFRYVSRKPPKEKLAPGARLRVAFGLQKGKLVMSGPEFDLKGSDVGNKLKRFQLGFYAIKGRVLVDDLEIRGTLADDWLRRTKVDLRTARPIGAAATGGLDEATQACLAAHAAGDLAATRTLLRFATDESRAAEARATVVEALMKGPRKAARPTVDLLYHEREDARALGIRIIKALLGKDYGYKPAAPEAKRSAAIKKLNEDLDKHPELLEG